MFGRCVPMVAMSHQYLLTESIPALEEWSHESGRKLPLLRDVDTSWYLRQEKFGLNLGPYERGCRAHWVGHDDPMPTTSPSSSSPTISNGWSGTSRTRWRGFRSSARAG